MAETSGTYSEKKLVTLISPRRPKNFTNHELDYLELGHLFRIMDSSNRLIHFYFNDIRIQCKKHNWRFVLMAYGTLSGETGVFLIGYFTATFTDDDIKKEKFIFEEMSPQKARTVYIEYLYTELEKMVSIHLCADANIALYAILLSAQRDIVNNLWKTYIKLLQTKKNLYQKRWVFNVHHGEMFDRQRCDG